jgi:lipopolysaccharide transport system ATP-binding protein
MSETVIGVNNLSKRYRIGIKEEIPNTLGGAIADFITRPAKNLRRLRQLSRFSEDDGHDPEDVIWALKDASFEVKRGEIVGVIGRNGSGKSTLLKIISHITEPTTGRVEILGRVSALLEVGTGFHPELTGRENVYLNGAILGMRKAEIDRKFDEIVDFSDVEKFIDTPVKRYSSGMSVRLAFAVAAHLEPDVLLVDEVLSVGDVKFQEKCIGKMKDVTSGGRTVLFVSHNMGSVQKLCSRALLIHQGRILRDGPTREVIGEYLGLGAEQVGERVWQDRGRAPGNYAARIRAVRVVDRNGQLCTDFDVRDSVFVQMEYWVLRDARYLEVAFEFRNERGEFIFAAIDDSTDAPSGTRARATGFYCSTCQIPSDFLNYGQLYVTAVLTDGIRVHTVQRDIVMFNVGDAMDANGARGNYATDWPPTAVRPRLPWTMERYPINHDSSAMVRRGRADPGLL